jgi:hypothetical protein
MKPHRAAALALSSLGSDLQIRQKDRPYTLARGRVEAIELAFRESCHSFRSNEVRLWLSVIGDNLGNLWRRLALPRGSQSRR